MGTRALIGWLSLCVLVSFVGCSTDPQKVQPETRGKRGERCQARNDCDPGLACLNGLCAKNEFEITVEAKHCDRVDCSTDEDCCGDRPSTAPAKCKDLDVICNQPTLPNCTQGACTSSDTCGDGSCRPGSCSITGNACMDSTECAEQCVEGFCSLTGIACTVSSTCTYYTAMCLGRSCDCDNPDYDRTNPICTDPACTDICLLRCDNERCLKDNSCKVDQDCQLMVGSVARLCDSGRCVQCKEDEDCDADSDETCVEGRCDRPCTQDEECGMFEKCDVDTGECLYRGCTSDRECVLAAARGNDGVGGGGPIGATTDDPRLYKCLESDADASIKICKIPCENDGSCGQFQLCDAGFCKFVGCETNEECRAYLGISDEMTSEMKPYISTAVCRE